MKNNIIHEIEDLKLQLKRKEEELLNSKIQKIVQLEQKINELEESTSEEMSQNKETVKKLEENLVDKNKKIKNATESISSKVSEFFTKRKEIERLEKENKKIKNHNQQIWQQQVNISNVELINEMAFLKLPMNIKEYKEKKWTDKIFKTLYDVNFTVKLGVDLNELMYQISEDKKTLSVYNVKLKRIGLEKTHTVSQVFADVRYCSKAVLGLGKDKWEVFEHDTKEFMADEDVQQEKKNIEYSIKKNIDNDKYIEKHIHSIKDDFNNALKHYIYSIIGKGFNIDLHEENEPNALTYTDCFNSFNKDLVKTEKPLKTINYGDSLEVFNTKILDEIKQMKK